MMAPPEDVQTLSLLEFVGKTYGADAATGIEEIFTRRNNRVTDAKDKFLPAGAGGYSVVDNGVIRVPDPRHADDKNSDITFTPRDNGGIDVEFVKGMSMVSYIPAAVAEEQREKNAAAIAAGRDRDTA